MLVCITICQGVLDESELPAEVLTHLQNRIETYRELMRRNSEETSP